MAVTTVDATWLSGHTGPPWFLNTPNTVYQLAADVDASGSFSGEVFRLVGPNVQLDLNGHFIRMNGQDIEQATRSADVKPNERRTENEHPAVPGTAADDIGGRTEYEKFHDTGSPRHPSDTGGRVPNTEAGTGHTRDDSRGLDQTGRAGRF